ncbi:MAG: TonB-dependent receptor, partial [Gammaproteobacteria bacterium]|nr:TonB-dependent receptor [Gammaproteobacteria bacterium]
SEDDANAWNYVVFQCDTGVTQVNPDVPCQEEFNNSVPNAPEGVGGGLPDMKPDGSSYNEYESWSVTLDLGYELDDAQITSVTNYNFHRNKWGLGQNVISPTSYIAATQNTSLDAFSNETRYQTNRDGPVNYMIGFYYQNTDRDHTQAGAFAPLEDSSLPPDRRFVSYIKPSGTDGETISGFGQVTWRVKPEVELAAGVRYIDETADSFLVQSYVQSALQGLFLENQPVTADQSFSEWTPEVTIAYYPRENLTFYGGFKSAYKSGGFAVSSLIVASSVPDDFTFEPETADGFEVGFKSILLDNQLRFNLNLYHYDYEDLQVDFFDSVTFQFITTNAGKAQVEGVEIDTQFAPIAVPGLFLSGYLNYNKARYTEYIAPCYTGQSISAGCNTNFGSGFGQDLSGAPLAVAPDWTAAVNGVYEKNFGSGLMWELGANIRYSDDFISSSFGAPLSLQDSYVNVDASFKIRSQDNRWEVALIARNLTDSFHISGETDLPNSGFGTGTTAGLPADPVGLVDLPRTVQLQYTHRF